MLFKLIPVVGKSGFLDTVHHSIQPFPIYLADCDISARQKACGYLTTYQHLVFGFFVGLAINIVILCFAVIGIFSDELSDIPPSLRFVIVIPVFSIQ